MSGWAPDAEVTAEYKLYKHKEGVLKRMTQKWRVPNGGKTSISPLQLHILLTLKPEDLPWPCQWGRAEGGEGISGSSVHPLESMAWGMWSLESASFLEVSNDSGLAHNSVVYLRRIWGRGCWPTLPLKCMMAITHSSSAKGKSYGTTQVATKWRGRGEELCLQR